MDETTEERQKAKEVWEVEQNEAKEGKQKKKKGGAAKPKKAVVKTKESRKAQMVEESSEENDDRPCAACKGDGCEKMVICDTKLADGGTCDRVYHLRCVGLKRTPKGEVRVRDSKNGDVPVSTVLPVSFVSLSLYLQKCTDR